MKVGFIGLGAMGKWMALNLVKAGRELVVYDLRATAVDELVRAGAEAADSIPAAAAETIMLSLPHAEVVEQVVNELTPALKPGTRLIDLGTTDYETTRRLGRRLAEQGVAFVDAPVTGAEERAREATLTVMFGGSDELFAEILPFFKEISSTQVHLGPLGAGQLAKMINNVLYNVSCAALAEVMPMAVKLGLDPDKMTEVVVTGSGRSFAAEYFLPLILAGKFDHGYPMASAYKDMLGMARLGAEKKIPLPVVHSALATYQTALARGLGDQSKGAMIKVFEELLDVRVRSGRS